MAKSSDAPEQRRAYLREFMHRRGLTPASWSRKAGRSPNTLYSFLKGRTASLTQGTLEALAAGEGVTVAEIIGDIPDSLRIEMGFDRVSFQEVADEIAAWLAKQKIQLPHEQFVRLALALYDQLMVRRRAHPEARLDPSELAPVVRLVVNQ